MTRRRRWGLGVLFIVFSLSAVAIGGADKGQGPDPNDPRSGAALNREAARNAQPAPPPTFPAPLRINAGAVNDPTADSTAQDTQSETSVAALGNKVVVAFNDSGSFFGGNNHFTGFASSSNTGATFTDHGILPASVAGDAGDPVLARDNATGAFYLTTLAFSTDDIIQFFKSTDGGQTFAPPVNATPGSSGVDSRDKSWMTVDNFAGTGQHNIYVCDADFASTTTKIDFFRSTDQGASFGPSGGTLISAGGQGCFIAMGPDHSVDVFYYRGTGGGGQEGDNKLFVRQSTDLGVTFGSEHEVADLNTTSVNGNLALNGGFRSNSFPQAAVNPISGDMVVVYNDDPNLGSTADNGDVFYVKSTDNGVTWSAPVRINEVAANDQFFPTVAITPDGKSIMFGYYDRSQDANNLWFHRRGRAGTMNTTSGAIVLRRSFQLGPNTPVAIGQDPIINSTYMGDYDTIDATNGFFHTTWADNRDGNSFHAHQPDVRYAQISTDVKNSDLAVTVTPTPASIDLGKNTTLVVTARASGGVAKDVFLNISPVTGLEFKSVPGSCRLDGQFVGCSLGNIDAGTSRMLNIVALGVSAGPRTVKATATTSSNDTNQVNNTRTGTVTVNNVPTTTSQFSTGNIAVPITDNSTVDVPIVVPKVGTVFKVQALVRLNHTWDADLDMFLIDPSAHVVELSTDNGSSGDDYGSGTNDCAGTPTTFTDSGGTAITAGAPPFAGAFRPEQPLSDLFGDHSAGTWKLRVTDDTSLDTGTIGCFKLKITHP
jgi:subtilisin-like proprotein convertase family protein